MPPTDGDIREALSHQCLSACSGVDTPEPFYTRIERVQRTKKMGARFGLIWGHADDVLMQRSPRKPQRNDRDGTPPFGTNSWSRPGFDEFVA